jgi:hypothetical protein
MHGIWPGREKWNAECLPPTPEEPNRDSPRVNPRVAFDKSLGLGRWSQMRQMEVHDYYRLDIGKPRILKRIKFKTETKNDLRYPKRYILEVSENDGGDMSKIGEEHDGPIDIELPKPQRIRIIKVTITKPMLDLEAKSDRGYPAWSIYDICLTEVRLFRRYWEKVIE